MSTTWKNIISYLVDNILDFYESFPCLASFNNFFSKLVEMNYLDSEAMGADDNGEENYDNGYDGTIKRGLFSKMQHFLIF
jgi:hypothetical protein